MFSVPVEGATTLKLIEISFVMVAFLIVKLLFIAESTEVTIEFPTLAAPDFDFTPGNFSYNPEFINLTGGCGGFTDCIEYLAAVIHNIGQFIEALVDIVIIAVQTLVDFVILIFQVLSFVFDLIVYVFDVFTLVLGLLFGTIDGAPWFVNLLMFAPYSFALGIIIYKMFRSGSTED